MTRGVKMRVNKNSILYFSGTGNTYDVSMQLATKCGFEMIHIASLIEEEIIEIDCEFIGIAFPIYYGGIPQVVDQIISKINALNSLYVFGIATYGGIPGNPFMMLKQKLQQRNLGLEAGFLINMPGNYLPMYGARKNAVQHKKIAKANKKTNQIAEIIRSKKTVAYEQVPHIPGVVEAKYIELVEKRVRSLATLDRHFNVDHKCNECGTCVKICPVKNMTMEKNQINWLGKCEQCMACIQYCPQEAIQYGNKTAGRVRYKNPHVNYLKVLLKEGEKR